MLYVLNDELTTVELDRINCYDLYTGYVNKNEWVKVADFLNIKTNICNKINNNYRYQIECYEDFMILNFKLLDNDFALYISKNMLLIIDLNDNSSDVINIFRAYINKISSRDEDVEKLVLLFFDTLFESDNEFLFKIEKKIVKLEYMVENNKIKSNFNLKLLDIKNKLLLMYKHYEFIIDASGILFDNYNDIFDKKNIKYFKYIEKKAIRLKGNAEFLRNNVIHLREAYQGTLELRLNETMKLLTAFTVAFSPLTFITSWYGMNFKNMLLINKNYGYYLVILFSICLSIVLILIFKRKKLFK